MACRLGSRHFKGLLMNHELSLSVTAKSHTREPDETHNRADAQGTEPNLVVGLITTANFGISNYNLAILYDVNAVTASAPELIPGNTDQESTGDLNGAIGTFEQFLNSGSASGNEAALAQYWLGDAYYMQRNYDMASRYLGAYLKAQPNGERSQAALNKLVESLRALGRTADADTLASQGVSALQ